MQISDNCAHTADETDANFTSVLADRLVIYICDWQILMTTGWAKKLDCFFKVCNSHIC